MFEGGPSDVAEEFGLTLPIPDLAPRYNAAPRQTIGGVALKRNGKGSCLRTTGTNEAALPDKH